MHSRRLCEYIGGISLQSQEIHSAALSREAGTPKIQKACDYIDGFTLQSQEICKRLLTRELAMLAICFIGTTTCT